MFQEVCINRYIKRRQCLTFLAITYCGVHQHAPVERNMRNKCYKGQGLPRFSGPAIDGTCMYTTFY